MSFDSSNDLLKSTLSKLSREEKRNAVKMLLQLGIHDYLMVISSDNNTTKLAEHIGLPIDMWSLNKLYTKSVHDLNEQLQLRKKFEREQRQFKPSIPITNNTKKNQYIVKLASEYERKEEIQRNHNPRSDSMTHYPFADDGGTVTEVLHSKLSSAIHYMSTPARKKLACQIFDELRIGVNGLRIVDVPEGLKLLGLYVSPKVKTAFKLYADELGIDLNNNTNSFTFPSHQSNATVALSSKGNSLGINNYKRKSVTPGVGKPLEPTLSLDDWIVIVNKYVRKEQEERMTNVNKKDVSKSYDDNISVDLNDIENEEHFVNYLLAPPINSYFPQSNTQSNKKDIKEDNNSSKHLSNVSNKHASKEAATLSSDNSINTSDNSIGDSSFDNIIFNNKINTTSKKNTNTGTNINKWVEVKDSYGSKLRKVQSKIGNQIKQDKSRYLTAKKDEDHAALSSIAKTRVERLIIEKENLMKSSSSSSSRQQQSVSINDYNKFYKSHKNNLNSGSAALDIANSFLKGSISDEISSNTSINDYEQDKEWNKTNDYDDSKYEGSETVDDLKNDEYDDKIDKIINERIKKYGNNKGNSNPNSTGSSIQNMKKNVSKKDSSGIDKDSLARRFKQMDTEEYNLEKQKTLEAKEIYASGWKSSKGGWVADFGPAHTHSLSTIPDTGITTAEIGVRPWQKQRQMETWNNRDHSNKTKEEIDRMIAKSVNILKDPSEFDNHFARGASDTGSSIDDVDDDDDDVLFGLYRDKDDHGEHILLENDNDDDDSSDNDSTNDKIKQENSRIDTILANVSSDSESSNSI